MIFDILVWTRSSRSGASSVTLVRINTVTRSPRLVFQAFFTLQVFIYEESFSIRPKKCKKKVKVYRIFVKQTRLDLPKCQTQKHFRIFVSVTFWRELSLWHKLIYLGMLDQVRWNSRLRNPLEETGIFWVSWKNLFRQPVSSRKSVGGLRSSWFHRFRLWIFRFLPSHFRF